MTTKTRNAEYLREVRAKAVAAGMCIECRCRPQKPGRRTCQHCLAKHKERAEAYVFVGLCECGAEPRPGRYLCKDCAVRDGKSKHRQFARLKAEGVCVRCRRAPAFANHVHCEPCLEAMRSYAKNRRRSPAAEAA